MRIGFFGGSFDPIHYGHLLLAEVCREAADLDEVWLVPAAMSPHKQGRAVTDGRHRLQMLRLAIGGHVPFVACDWEVLRGGVSFTVESLERLRVEREADELFLLMGADSLVDFPAWCEPQRICQLATPLIVRRPQSPEPDLRQIAAWLTTDQIAVTQSIRITMPLIELSSSDLRQRVRAGQSIRFRTPQAVEKYIEAQSLYRDETTVSLSALPH